jgi:hypothetical protein
LQKAQKMKVQKMKVQKMKVQVRRALRILVLKEKAQKD